MDAQAPVTDAEIAALNARAHEDLAEKARQQTIGFAYAGVMQSGRRLTGWAGLTIQIAHTTRCPRCNP